MRNSMSNTRSRCRFSIFMSFTLQVFQTLKLREIYRIISRILWCLWMWGEYHHLFARLRLISFIFFQFNFPKLIQAYRSSFVHIYTLVLPQSVLKINIKSTALYTPSVWGKWGKIFEKKKNPSTAWVTDELTVGFYWCSLAISGIYHLKYKKGKEK